MLENLSWTEPARGWAWTQSFWGGGGDGGKPGLRLRKPGVFAGPVEGADVAGQAGAGNITWVVGLHLEVCGWAFPG